ncbi:2'-5' RNA ligase family protein [Streptomyces sp. BE303]|uniref:2'-5' RNA ligase family protein n=1 Tax=Streptomycetaceae TaxID=2062 RepID=UPI002E760191|nr:2'-5' RNA ligase family protein [Streptomyces sp. BE303]MED7953722.1 2'-5' RNA ligase family protein [Streptomyces sp. BE303]
MQTVELLCDAPFDRAVRTVWQRLADGGVDSLAHNTHPGHRPHLTLASCARMPDGATERLDRLLRDALPLTVRLTGLLSFSARSRRRVLSLPVVPTLDLVLLHHRVWEALDGAEDPDQHYVPGRWSPHLSLTRRLTPEDVALAHTLLGRHPDHVGSFDAARSFDSETQLARPLGAG